jgi:uncharacterized membrane protein
LINTSKIRKVELFLYGILRTNVVLSGFIVLIGIGFLFLTGNTSRPVDAFSLEWVLYGDPFFEPSHIIFIGLMILIVTPIIRITANTITYTMEKDWRFALINGAVLAILIISMIMSVK